MPGFTDTLTGPTCIRAVARASPQIELSMGPGSGGADEVPQEFSLDDLDRSPEFNPADSVPVPEDDFDQSGRA